jgi:hypothetical protein
MDDHRFDHVTRLLAMSSPRRVVSGAMASVVLTTFLHELAEDAAGKKKRKKGKKKKKPSCTPSCFNKVCGQDDGCGRRCTVQAGCDANEACVDGACAANVCDPACTGNLRCQPDGSCDCPPGLKECATGLGNPGFCHECCQDPFGGGGDTDCEGNPNGAYCRAAAGDPVGRCRCISEERTCPNGACGVCCGLSDCFSDYFGEGPVDIGRDCVVVNQQTGEFGCACRSGTTQCPDGIFCAAPGNRRACGPSCEWCGFRTDYEPNYVCTGNPQRCCLPTGAPCALANEACCSGLNGCVLNAAGTTFVCT